MTDQIVFNGALGRFMPTELTGEYVWQPQPTAADADADVDVDLGDLVDDTAP